MVWNMKALCNAWDGIPISIIFRNHLKNHIWLVHQVPRVVTIPLSTLQPQFSDVYYTMTVYIYIYGCIYQCPSSVSRTHWSIYKQKLSSVFGLNLHCKKKRPGLLNWAWLTQLQSESRHSKILFCAVQEWSGLITWYWDSTCLLPNCPWKLNVLSYNVSAC